MYQAVRDGPPEKEGCVVLLPFYGERIASAVAAAETHTHTWPFRLCPLELTFVFFFLYSTRIKLLLPY